MTKTKKYGNMYFTEGKNKWVPGFVVKFILDCNDKYNQDP